jgi:hypothetical protein
MSSVRNDQSVSRSSIHKGSVAFEDDAEEIGGRKPLPRRLRDKVSSTSRNKELRRKVPTKEGDVSKPKRRGTLADMSERNKSTERMADD